MNPRRIAERVLVPRRYRGEASQGMILAITLRVAFLCLIPSLVAIGFTWKEAGDRVADVNASRAEISYASCLLTNRRHDRTIRRLNILTRERKQALVRERENATPLRVVAIDAELLRIQSSQRATVFIIEALVPRVNCERQARSRFGFTPENGALSSPVSRG